VTEKREGVRGIARHRSRTLRSCTLGIVTGGSHEMTDHVVRVVDLSVAGVGIESSSGSIRDSSGSRTAWEATSTACSPGAGKAATSTGRE